MTSLKTLFLQQSYVDAYDEYVSTLKSKNAVLWDYIIITASNELQAEAYRLQLRYRLDNNMLPKTTHYAVLPDPDGKRVGSGGATLNVLKYIREYSGDPDCFTGKRILVIHSGGDSQRIPQYSACGKLFSPVPRELPNNRPSTLFDELIIVMSGIPARMRDGMLVLSGDVLLLFNPLQVDFHQNGAAALSIKKSVAIGKNHGVFLKDEHGDVSRFLHKMSVDELEKFGAVDEYNNVDLDTGAVMFDSNLVKDLFGLISTDGNVDLDKYDRFVNDRVRLNLYGDFLYPLSKNSSLSKYCEEKPENISTSELLECRTAIWETLKDYSMRLISLAPAEFIHFGTTRELLNLVTKDIDEYEFLGWNRKVNTNILTGNYSAYNSYINEHAKIADGCYIENSYILENVSIGENSIVSHVTLRNVTVPANTVLHGIKLKNGKYVVRKYKVDDNPKENELWEADLYSVCDSMEAAVCNSIADNKAGVLMSLYSSFNNADVKQILQWQDDLFDKVIVERMISAIRNRVYIEDVKRKFSHIKLKHSQYNMLLNIASNSDFSDKIRIYHYLSYFVPEESEDLQNSCFKAIRDSMLRTNNNVMVSKEDFRVQKESVTVRLPLRVNWGGGWSDTPPYCIEKGGTVLNAAIKVNGEFPVEVKLERLDDLKVVFESTDIGIRGEFTDIRKLQDCSNPFDPFALHKAALIACGIISAKNGMLLEDVLNGLGGGLYLSTCVHGIPRGSGLGTSSILAGACVKGIFEFIGQSISENQLYATVLIMEQIMSTGGGWQDQVGGLTTGIKMVTSKPGLNQVINYEPIQVPHEALQDLQERFCLIYTGQRRLARNLLREVMGKYIGGNPTSISTLHDIQKMAVLMKFELEKGNIDRFAELLDRHWDLSKLLDKGSTNTCLEHIIFACEDMLAGKMICGAGGGGFLQAILKRGISKEDLSRRLKSVFGDTGVDVWNCEFVF